VVGTFIGIYRLESDVTWVSCSYNAFPTLSCTYNTHVNLCFANLNVNSHSHLTRALRLAYKCRVRVRARVW
jgi:hypothetical protein